MSSPTRRRGTRVGVGLASVVALGSALAACGGGGSALVQQACTEVTHSIALYHEAASESPAKAQRLRAQALVDLRRALRPAALAGSAGGQYEALQATLSESSRVPEARLIGALAAQCAAATSGSS